MDARGSLAVTPSKRESVSSHCVLFERNWKSCSLKGDPRDEEGEASIGGRGRLSNILSPIPGLATCTAEASLIRESIELVHLMEGTAIEKPEKSLPLESFLLLPNVRLDMATSPAPIRGALR